MSVFVNPQARKGRAAVQDAHAAASTLGLQVRVVIASTSDEIDLAFATPLRERPDALLLINDPLFSSQAARIVQLAARHALPAFYSLREFPEIGGLMSYGTDIADVYRQMGVYTGRVLKGTKPADLPVVQSTKFEFVLNLKTARVLGIEVPANLLARADDVIE